MVGMDFKNGERVHEPSRGTIHIPGSGPKCLRYRKRIDTLHLHGTSAFLQKSIGLFPLRDHRFAGPESCGFSNQEKIPPRKKTSDNQTGTRVTEKKYGDPANYNAAREGGYSTEK